MLTTAGAEEKGASTVLDKMVDTWKGPKEEEAKADPKPVKTTKHHKS